LLSSSSRSHMKGSNSMMIRHTDRGSGGMEENGECAVRAVASERG
jgi:hypothetical protein